MGEFSVMHLLVLAVILLVFFGPSRLPGLGQSIGKAIRGFKDGLSETSNDITQTAQKPNEQINPANAVDDLHARSTESEPVNVKKS